jgi:hypothetical protein
MADSVREENEAMTTTLIENRLLYLLEKKDMVAPQYKQSTSKKRRVAAQASSTKHQAIKPN